jgi:NAD(P)-dependent dehydrogenase (short-subunit alcohol dehydrogenase family)
MAKTVIITGAAGGLGTVVTKVFLDKGYRVVATVSNESSKKDLPPHDNLEVLAVNLTNEEATNTFIQSAIAKYDRIDGALLLVGGFTMGNIAATAGADLEKQFSLNFNTAYYTTRPLFQHMLQNKAGRIVFIGARPALVAAQGKNVLAYGLSKSLLFKLAEYLNEEAKGKNVTVTVIAPSTIDTPANRKSMPDAEAGNWVKPEQLAEILEFIISDKSAVLRETVLKVYNNA